MSSLSLYRPLTSPFPLSSKLRPAIRGQVTRMTADSTLESASEKALLRCLRLPPDPPVATPTYQLSCLHNAIFLAGVEGMGGGSRGGG